ncbi:GspH/FimT family pseudopilin [Pseudomonas stutzeri]|uniref:GspH/FimT family pseudopilin n=1 Tax=Stutzerimonas stutzeri TaxID=316 RepID=UPI00210E0329|nr:GspH/FimT family pseudopilin [Stutzerimonas stutzeri]MCQ4309777.1 GspH/FimT family pseudopilin [Stutzerimonas stutzeri]
MNPCSQRAFTLIELLTTIAILSVLLGIAVPSFASLIERNQQTAATHDLLAALNHARGLAITRRELVSLCAGINDCNASANWEQSILIFSDPNQNGQFDAGEHLHRVVTLPDRYRWNWNNFRSRTFMTFKANGMTDSLNGTYTLCSGNEAIQQLVMNITGRLRTESPENHNACN